VITVAPQYLICPQGNKYPIKAMPIESKNKVTPLDQTSNFLYDPITNPRII